MPTNCAVSEPRPDASCGRHNPRGRAHVKRTVSERVTRMSSMPIAVAIADGGGHGTGGLAIGEGHAGWSATSLKCPLPSLSSSRFGVPSLEM